MATRRLLNPGAQIDSSATSCTPGDGHDARQPRAADAGTSPAGSPERPPGARKPEVSGARSVLASLQHRAAISINTQLSQRRDALAALASQLELLNPQRTLERGYAIVTDEAGAVMRAPTQLQAAQQRHRAPGRKAAPASASTASIKTRGQD
jgi:exodeoxyribonuclease VII large subunit